MVLAIVLTPHGHWWTWALYGVGVVILIDLSQVSLSLLVRRVGVEFAFVGVVILGTLFRQEGEVLWQWGVMRVTTVGVTVLGSVALKTILSLFLLNVLTLSTAIPDLLSALALLRTPPLLVAILGAMYRYLDILIEEFQTMRRAALSRNLLIHRNWQRLLLGHMVGALFIRTLERGERIHQAMLSRGFTGLPPAPSHSHLSLGDKLWVGGVVIFALGGQLLYWLGGVI